MLLSPLTTSCLTSLNSREHICLGISPFNSLFSEDYIGDLIYWSKNNFETFHLFLPDEPTYFTLEALGYDETECRKKMKKQLNWLRNKINKALLTNDLNPEDNYLLDWEKLSNNSVFNHELNKVYALFDHDQTFRNECLEASHWVLQNKMDKEEITEAALLKAVKYFLAEIPLFAATNKIVGKETSIFCYHQSISFHKKLYSGDLSYKAQAGQGYGKVSEVNSGHRESDQNLENLVVDAVCN